MRNQLSFVCALFAMLAVTTKRTLLSEMRTFAPILIGAVLLIGCQSDRNTGGPPPEGEGTGTELGAFTQVTVTQERPSPNVDITGYVVITEDAQTTQEDAEAIMRLKALWPLAMQTKDEALFERILAQNFTFRAEDQFWNRTDYILDRVNPVSVTVESARYENLVLQFFGELALLTYRNVVDVTQVDGSPSTISMSWADIYVRERGQWRIGGSHLIDLRQEELEAQ